MWTSNFGQKLDCKFSIRLIRGSTYTRVYTVISFHFRFAYRHNRSVHKKVKVKNFLSFFLSFSLSCSFFHFDLMIFFTLWLDNLKTTQVLFSFILLILVGHFRLLPPTKVIYSLCALTAIFFLFFVFSFFISEK
jgi:hypothetical protein